MPNDTTPNKLYTDRNEFVKFAESARMTSLMRHRAAPLPRRSLARPSGSPPQNRGMHEGDKRMVKGPHVSEKLKSFNLTTD